MIRTRLQRPALTSFQARTFALGVVATITGLAVLGAWSPLIAVLAAGAGAGYSLSGSV